MDTPEPPAKTRLVAGEPVVIPYAVYGVRDAAAPGPRRIWVYVLVGIYLAVVGAMLTLPVWGQADLGPDGMRIVAPAITVLGACGLALLIVPVRVKRRRPVTRRSIVVPIVASGLLMGGLVLGGGFALAELFAPLQNGGHEVSDRVGWSVVIVAVAVWAAWAVLFLIIVRGREPASLGMKLHRALIAGSILELFVAVPAHIIVRRRNECCAGIMTGTGICLGVAVALVSFGPSVLLLYFNRRKQITGSSHLPSKVDLPKDGGQNRTQTQGFQRRRLDCPPRLRLRFGSMAMKILLANPRGFCAGVNMAIECVDQVLAIKGPPVYVYHEIVHNRHVVDGFRNRGVTFVDEIEQVPEGSVVVYSAHGISPRIRESAQRRRLVEVDATCPLVTKVHMEVLRYVPRRVRRHLRRAYQP